jgi:hypothetical protein
MAVKTGYDKVKHVEWLARLMDSQFKIPGTNIRFGLDPLIGLIPGIGDFAGFLISGYMLSELARNGASGFVLARMTLNIVIDALIGSIPLVGDLFDAGFKANEKNIRLMREHYIEGRHKGSAKKVIIPLLLILFIILGVLGWLGYKLVMWLFNAI